MKTFEVEVKRTQFITVKVEAESIREAIDRAEDPEITNWFPWDQVENASYDAIHINEIPVHDIVNLREIPNKE